MNDSDIPLEVRDFIARYIRSVGHLDVLLVLYDAPDSKWDSEKISTLLRTNNDYAKAQLGVLAYSGLLSADSDGKYFYSKASEFDEIIFKLKSIYKLKRATVITFIYSREVDPIQQLADAFKLKK